MASLSSLHRAVQNTLASKRIGKVVFVRYILQGKDAADSAHLKLAAAVAAVANWIGSPLDKLYGLPGDGNQVSLTLQFRDGATALVNFAHGPVHGDGVDLLVVGNHGAIYHDAGTASLWDEEATVAEKPNPAMVAAIERALRSGKPESLGQEGQP